MDTSRFEVISDEKPKFLTCKHSGNAGDIIYSIPSLKKVCESTKSKLIYYLRLDTKGQYYQGAVHPLGDVMFNSFMFSMIKPLLEAQPFIESVEIFKGQPVHVDLDAIRQRHIGLPNGSIMRWYFMVYPDMNTDLSKKWLTYIPNEQTIEMVKDSIIVNLTERYRNNWIDYSFLQNSTHDRKIWFVGTMKEYQLFLPKVPKAQYLHCEDFNDLACAIDNCHFFIGNQSMCFAIAEGLKKDRILELCSYAMNVIPEGSNGFDFFEQGALHYYVKCLHENRRP